MPLSPRYPLATLILLADTGARGTDNVGEARGLVTGVIERVMDSPSVQFVATVTGYDNEERPVHNVQTFHTPGVFLVTENYYDEIGGSLQWSRNRLIHPDGEHTDHHLYRYDTLERLVAETVRFDGGEPETIKRLTYNEIGNLATADFGAVAENYTYNVRGAMTSRQSEVFGQTLSYEGIYNGNIASVSDCLGGVNSTNRYSYDPANRLTSAEITIDGVDRSTSYTYDLNGNILTLSRLGHNGVDASTPIDALTYNYSGNKVVGIDDASEVTLKESSMNFIDGSDEQSEYSYDSNGNMIEDKNRGIKYQWDSNNRLQTAYYNPGVHSFTYTSGGRRLSRTYAPYMNYSLLSDGEYPGKLFQSRSLSGSFIGGGVSPWSPINKLITYTYDSYGPYEYTDGRFTRVNTSTGYRDSIGTHVYVRDWQGNIRAVVRSDGDGGCTVEQTNYYYPYGMPMGESTNPDVNRYKYTAKELLTQHSLNLMDYGARFYDPTTCRWLNPDPLTGSYRDNSHYSFCASNPINLIDPTGLAWRPTYDEVNERNTGYEWIEPEKSYDADGNLLEGLYEQAIFFSSEGENGVFDSNSVFNIGTSTATVYKSDGTTEEFNACTYPSSLKKYATVPEGMYEAKVGFHKGYTALRMGDVGTENFYNNQIELGQPNPSAPERTKAVGINIHKPGKNNFTGVDGSGNAMSQGCLLIDRNKWDSFIKLFNPNAIVGVILSRSLVAPTNKNVVMPLVVPKPYMLNIFITHR